MARITAFENSILSTPMEDLIFDNIEQTPRLWFSMVSRARKIVHDPSHEEERRANGHSILTIATIATGNVFSIEY